MSPSSHSLPLPLLFLFLLCSPRLTAATAIDLDEVWTISLRRVWPNGVGKVVPVVNNRLPGPILRGRAGQVVRITVINALPASPASIHWHGVKQRGTPWADGTPGVTQCAITPGESYTYEFTLDADGAGTVWWHSHVGFQRASVHGAIIVDGVGDIGGDVEERYDDERVLILSGWYHASDDEQAETLTTGGWIGDPDSLLINGHGFFNCTDDHGGVKQVVGCHDYRPDQIRHAVIDVRPETRYRLRLVAAPPMAFMNFGVDGHEMIVVQADTTATKAMRVRRLDIGGGQTYSVLLRTKSAEEVKAGGNDDGTLKLTTGQVHYLALRHVYLCNRVRDSPD